MSKLDLEGLASVLAEAGIAVAVVEREGGLSLANAAAKRLGDPPVLALLAAQTLSSPGHALDHEVGEEGPWRLQAVARRDQTILIGRLAPELAAAQRALRSSDDFLSFASHELKGPLHVLGLASHLIEARVGRGEPVERTTIDQIRRQVVRLTRLINQLLDVTRVKQSRLELVMERCDLAAVVRAAIEHADPARAADVTSRGIDRPLPVQADRARVTEVVGELLDNALRATPPGGGVSVEVASGGGVTSVTVSDAGPGVAEEERAGLFDAVPHSRGARKSPTQGLGLGLHIARALAQLHGGDLTYQPGSPGSIFRFTLPS